MWAVEYRSASVPIGLTDTISRVTGRITVVEYQPRWPSEFMAIASRLREEMREVALRVDHVGSTAVPGLAAKPIIDIQISVAALEPLGAYRSSIERAGFVHRPDNPDHTKRYFRESSGEARTHIHVRRVGSFAEQSALLLRDYLRAHPDRAKAYAVLKRTLADDDSIAHDRDAYMRGKEPFIWKTLQRASAWSQAVGWEPALTDA